MQGQSPKVFKERTDVDLSSKILQNAYEGANFIKEVCNFTQKYCIFQNFQPKLPQVISLGETPSFVEHFSLSASGNLVENL